MCSAINHQIVLIIILILIKEKERTIVSFFLHEYVSNPLSKYCEIILYCILYFNILYPHP